jgi:cellulose biosynthesis protein BcsQ
MKVLAAYNIKGGVGKTAAAVNLAALAAHDGLRTLLWDLDPQGAASFLLRVRPKVKGGGRKLVRGRSELPDLLRGTDVEGLDLLPADFSYRHLDLALDDTKRPTRQLSRLVSPLAEHYDLLLVDCQPSISLVSESVFDAADALVVPMIPTPLSLRTFDQLVDYVRAEVQRQPEIVGFFSMVDRRKRLHRDLVASLPKERKEVAPVAIPAATEVEQMGVQRQAVVDSAPTSRAAIAYRELWAEVRTRTGIDSA